MIVSGWKVQGLYKADAQKVADEILTLGDSVEPSAVVEKAKDESTELHKCFEWRNDVAAERGLVPVTFTEWSLDERLMSPKKGAPVTVRLSHFSGWRATFRIDYTEHVYSLEQIVNIINLAGFGLGIGSGRTSGYGRYKVVGVE